MANTPSLNEVQFPKELQRGEVWREVLSSNIASMKCSSRRNCNQVKEFLAEAIERPQ